MLSRKGKKEEKKNNPKVGTILGISGLKNSIKNPMTKYAKERKADEKLKLVKGSFYEVWRKEQDVGASTCIVKD